MSNLPVESEPTAPAKDAASNPTADVEEAIPADQEMIDTESKDGDLNKKEDAKNAADDQEPGKNGEDTATKNDFKNGDRPGSKPYRKHKDREYGNRKRENKSKYDASKLPITDDPSAIRAQVEFYFGDSNLPGDGHLWELTDGTSNNPVPLEKILEFNRMKRFQPQSAVLPALKESKFLVVSGEEGNESVSRKFAYTLDPKNKLHSRSIYAKGFGDEEPTSQFDIEAFFAPYGPTNSIRLRRHPDDKAFKGSVFVEFGDEETAEKFLALEPKPLYKDKFELEIKSKQVYMDEKNKLIQDGLMEPNEHRPFHGPSHEKRGRGNDRRGGFRGDRDRDYQSRGKGDRDPDDWKKRREDDRASGFKDRGHRDNNRNHHKGGRGRGGRDNRRHNGRGDRHDRNDRNREREDRENEEKATADGNSEKEKNGLEDTPSSKPVEVPATNEKKRAREDDGGAEEVPLKKVDTKSD